MKFAAILEQPGCSFSRQNTDHYDYNIATGLAPIIGVIIFDVKKQRLGLS
jgi:23S rRNA maturation mini-RNase III